MRRLFAARNIPVLIEIAGVLAITTGVAFLFWPAAFIVGGLMAIFLAQGVSRP